MNYIVFENFNKIFNHDKLLIYLKLNSLIE